MGGSISRDYHERVLRQLEQQHEVALLQLSAERLRHLGTTLGYAAACAGVGAVLFSTWKLVNGLLTASSERQYYDANVQLAQLHKEHREHMLQKGMDMGLTGKDLRSIIAVPSSIPSHVPGVNQTQPSESFRIEGASLSQCPPRANMFQVRADAFSPVPRIWDDGNKQLIVIDCPGQVEADVSAKGNGVLICLERYPTDASNEGRSDQPTARWEWVYEPMSEVGGGFKPPIWKLDGGVLTIELSRLQDDGSSCQSDNS